MERTPIRVEPISTWLERRRKGPIYPVVVAGETIYVSGLPPFDPESGEVTRKRRFAYYRIASPLVAGMRESIKLVAAIETPPRHRPRSARDDALCFARTCYDHLAGQCGVAITDALVKRGHLVLSDEGGEVTPPGEKFLASLGVDLVPPAGSRRMFCRPCLDWSERRYHLKGVVGTAILQRLLELGWFKRERDTRALRLTAVGRAGLADLFGIELAETDRRRGPRQPPRYRCRLNFGSPHFAGAVSRLPSAKLKHRTEQWPPTASIASP